MRSKTTITIDTLAGVIEIPIADILARPEVYEGKVESGLNLLQRQNGTMPVFAATDSLVDRVEKTIEAIAAHSQQQFQQLSPLMQDWVLRSPTEEPDAETIKAVALAKQLQHH